MHCLGEDTEVAKAIFNPPRTVMITAMYGEHVGESPAGVRDDLLDAGGTYPETYDEMEAVGVEAGFADDGTGDIPAYLEQHVVGPGIKGQLPYNPGELLEWVDSFYATGTGACPPYGDSDRFAERLKLVTRAAVHRCSSVADIDTDCDVDQSDLGLLLATYELPSDDPNYNPDADLDGDDAVGQSDLGILLADFGCGTRLWP